MPALNYSLEDFKKFTVKVITTELLDVIANAPLMDDKKHYIAQALDEIFKDVDLTKSFTSPLCIVYDETFYEEVIVGIHYWLRTKCADIENITIITAEHNGMAQWWSSWCQVHHERSFNIVEMSYGFSHFLIGELIEPPDVQDTTSQKNIQHYFNLYGGSYPTKDKLYLILKSLELYHFGIVEYVGNFSTKQDVLDYVEHITYFKNQQEIDHISKLYDQYILGNKLIIKSITDNSVPSFMEGSYFFTGHQYYVDNHCFASIVRETINDQPFSTVTEKTYRAFLHQMAVVPVGYHSVKYLEVQGFWFPHDIINYDYQYEPDYSRRVTALIESVKQFTNQYSIEDLQQYYQTNVKKFQHNAQLCYTIRHDPLITYRKLNQCDI